MSRQPPIRIKEEPQDDHKFVHELFQASLHLKYCTQVKRCQSCWKDILYPLVIENREWPLIRIHQRVCVKNFDIVPSLRAQGKINSVQFFSNSCLSYTWMRFFFMFSSYLQKCDWPRARYSWRLCSAQYLSEHHDIWWAKAWAFVPQFHDVHYLYTKSFSPCYTIVVVHGGVCLR